MNETRHAAASSSPARPTDSADAPILADPDPPGTHLKDETPTPNLAANAGGWKRVVFLVCAGVFFVLGSLGALLPILPATPFLLLTSYFLLRSSPRLNTALLRSRLFGPILIDWQQHGGVRYDVKLKAICIVAIAVGVTIYLTNFAPIPTVAVLLGAAIGIIVVLRLPTATG